MPDQGYSAGSYAGAGVFGSGRELTVLADLARAFSALSNELKTGTGAPTAPLAGSAGQYYFRTDTPTVPNQRIYVSTAVGVWVGIL